MRCGWLIERRMDISLISAERSTSIEENLDLSNALTANSSMGSWEEEEEFFDLAR